MVQPRRCTSWAHTSGEMSTQSSSRAWSAWRPGAEGAGLLEVGHERGGSDEPLGLDGPGELLHVGVGAPTLQHPDGEGAGPLADPPADAGVAAHLLDGVPLLHHGLVLRALAERHRLVVPGQPDVVRRLEQAALVAELLVDGLHGDPRRRRDLGQPHAREALGDEQVVGRVEHLAPALPGPRGAAAVVVLDPLFRHSLQSPVFNTTTCKEDSA